MLPLMHLWLAEECARAVYGHNIPTQDLTRVYAGALAPDIIKTVRKELGGCQNGSLEGHINSAGEIYEAAIGADDRFSLGVLSHGVGDFLVPFYREKAKEELNIGDFKLGGFFEIINSYLPYCKPARMIESYAFKGACELWAMRQNSCIDEVYMGLKDSMAMQITPYLVDYSTHDVNCIVNLWFMSMEEYHDASSLNQFLIRRLNLEGGRKDLAAKAGPKWMGKIIKQGHISDIFRKGITTVKAINRDIKWT